MSAIAFRKSGNCEKCEHVGNNWYVESLDVVVCDSCLDLDKTKLGAIAKDRGQGAVAALVQGRAEQLFNGANKEKVMLDNKTSDVKAESLTGDQLRDEVDNVAKQLKKLQASTFRLEQKVVASRTRKEKAELAFKAASKEAQVSQIELDNHEKEIDRMKDRLTTLRVARNLLPKVKKEETQN